MKELTSDMAMKILAASERWSRDIAGLPSSIAVVDRSGTVIAAHRMDGAGPLTIDIAIEKAWSMIAFRQPTLMLSRFLDPRNVGSTLGDHGMGLVTKGKGRLTLIAGSVPITDDEGGIIGAIGSSGIPSGVGDISDTSVCQAGWAALYD